MTLYISQRLGLIVFVILLLSVTILIGTSIGEIYIPFDVVLKTIANKLWDAGYPLDRIDEGIVWNYRLSRTVIAALCGMALALSGTILQALLRNMLADPYLLGISAGASTGAVAVVILGIGAGMLSVSFGAFLGAITAFILVALLAFRTGKGHGGVILAGIAGSQLFNAITSFIITHSASAEQTRGIMFWLLGSLSGVRWPDVSLAFPVTALGLLICLWYARSLDAFTFGADSAASLGIPVKRTYIVLIVCATLMTATMVSIVGAIGFVGLVIPHATRAMIGLKHHRLLPTVAIVGAIFLVAADIVSRTIIKGQVLPIGVITALVGAPVFALILSRRER